ncbi:hypothetical protein [Acinetobacter sp. A47]|uniref:hypothetical protein n=1 Tax=Acinetobacter sp. A47 TaxID=1561217 RepID=UPI0013791D71|nr:hypothetical protein [Acinetobacter sp. A47]
MPFRVGDAAAVQPMQCEMTAPGDAAKYAVARLFRSARECCMQQQRRCIRL